MQLTLLAVGKLRSGLRDVCDDYLRRLHRVVNVVECEVRESGRAASPEAQQVAEGTRLLARVSAQQALVLLDRDGEMWSSETLAERFEQWRQDARDRVIAIGGANGVSTAVRSRADLTWSLGALTLPHELARVVAVEQIYRATTIISGHPYHRGSR